MGVIGLIIKREFISKIKNKTFLIMTFVSPLMVVGLIALVSYLSIQSAQKQTKIAVCDASGYLFDAQAEKNDMFSDLTALGFEFAKNEVSTEKYNGLLVLTKDSTAQNMFSYQYYSNDNPSLELIYKTEQFIENRFTKLNLTRASIDLDLIEKAKVAIDLELYNLSGQNGVKGVNELKMFIGGAFGYLIMMFIVIYGNMVMRSVIEEKSNRIIEIIISSVTPFKLMIGKIIGTSMAGLAQFFIWLFLGGILLSVVSFWIGAPVATPSGASNAMMPQHDFQDIAIYLHELFQLPIATILGSFVIYFIGGYLLYSSFYASIGAAVDSETDSQQFLFPIISPLILAVYVGFFTVMNDPHGTTALVFSMIPFTSPIVMLMRIPFGVPWWQIIASVTILFSTFMAVVWFASKIYRVGILMHGKKPTYKELYKWIRY